MFKNYFKGIEGIADYPVISLVLFFLFFVIMIAWWMRTGHNKLAELSELPFSQEELNGEPQENKKNPI